MIFGLVITLFVFDKISPISLSFGMVASSNFLLGAISIHVSDLNSSILE